jgi:hypothetical protein
MCVCITRSFVTCDWGILWHFHHSPMESVPPAALFLLGLALHFSHRQKIEVGRFFFFRVDVANWIADLVESTVGFCAAYSGWDSQSFACSRCADGQQYNADNLNNPEMGARFASSHALDYPSTAKMTCSLCCRNAIIVHRPTTDCSHATLLLDNKCTHRDVMHSKYL